MRNSGTFWSATILIVVLSINPQAANAIPIDFSESVGGDLPYPTFPNNSIDFDSFLSFNADIGTNVLAGHFSNYTSPTYFVDWDNFRMIVPDNMFISLVTLEVTNPQTTGNVTSWSGGLNIWRDGTIFDSDAFCVIANGGSACSTLSAYPLPLWQFGPGATPLGGLDNGTFDVMLGPSGSSGSADGSGLDFDWRLAFTVEERLKSVPEPGTAALLIISLAALRLAGRRRKSPTPIA